MPYTIRFADEIAQDIMRDTAANSDGRISDANPMAVYRTIVEEGISPEMENEYLSGREILEDARFNEAQGDALDTLLADWKYADAEDKLERLVATATTGWASFFATRETAGTSTEAGTSTTLKDVTQNWSTNQYAGRMLRIVAGIGVGQERLIASNTATVLTINNSAPWPTAGWATIPQAGTKYEIIKVAVGDVPIPSGTRVFAQGVDLDTQLRFKTTVAPSTVVSSAATGGSIAIPTLPTLQDTGESWTVDEHAGRMVVIRSGSGAGQLGVIRSNTSNTLTVVPLFPYVTWTVAPTGTSVYDILEGTLPAGAAKAPVPVLALEKGDSHNIALYTLTNFEDTVANAESVWNTDAEANPARFMNGRNREGDPALRERWRRYMQGLTRGTKRAIKTAILNYVDPSTGNKPVHSVAINETVYPAFVYVEDGSGTAPSPLLTKLQQLLDATGPFAGRHELYASGYPHIATSSVASTVAVVVTILAIRDGFSFADVVADMKTRIQAYFDTLKIGDDVIYLSFLTAAVAPGVLDLSVATLNGASSNIAIAANAKAIISTLTAA